MRLIELVSSLKWYFEVKNQSLIDALSITCPMDVEAQRSLRIYYSQYFSSLISITELMKESHVPENHIFVCKLYSALDIQSTKGKDVYDYMRELRNSIVHRGLDITSAAHVFEGRPLIIFPEYVYNKTGIKQYHAPCKYLIELILHCENIIPDLITNHITEYIYEDAIKPEDNIEELTIEYITNSSVMPDWVKERALKSVKELPLLDMYKAQVDSAIKTIKEKVIFSE